MYLSPTMESDSLGMSSKAHECNDLRKGACRVVLYKLERCDGPQW